MYVHLSVSSRQMTLWNYVYCLDGGAALRIVCWDKEELIVIVFCCEGGGKIDLGTQALELLQIGYVRLMIVYCKG